MKTLRLTRRKVTSVVTLGLLLLAINNGRASLPVNADGTEITKSKSEIVPTPTPSRTITPIPTVTPSATPISTPPSTPSPPPVTTPSPPPATPAPSVSHTSAFPGLGSAGKYTVLSLTGTFQNQTGTTINGDVGIGPNSAALIQGPSTITGSVFYDPSTRYASSGSVINGTYVQSMMQPSLDAWTASNYYKNYATQSNVFASISAATTIVAQSGFNVFSLSSGINLNNADLTLSGSSNDYFVFNIYGGFTLTGTSSIRLLGGLTSSNVLFNIIGPGSALTTQLGSTVRGTILSIGRSISFNGVFIGQIIGGGPGSTFALLTGTTVGPATASIRSVPDQGSAGWLSLIALGFVISFERCLRKKPARRKR